MGVPPRHPHPRKGTSKTRKPNGKQAKPRRKYVAKDKPPPAIVLPNLRESNGSKQEDPILTNMRHFHAFNDWKATWEDFYLSINPDGSYKYRTVREFARLTAESMEQYVFLCWYLGPVVPDDEGYQRLAAKYPYVTGGAVDWADKRVNGGWYSEQNLLKYGAEITRRMNALDALRECGNRVTLRFLSRAAKLADAIDTAFKGAMFIPGQDFNANVARAKAYMDLHQRCLNYAAKAQETYAQAHGINFNDLAGMTHLMQAVAMAAVQSDKAEGRVVSKSERAVAELTEMILNKSAQYKLSLPVDVEAKIVEAVTEVETERAFKKKVQ